MFVTIGTVLMLLLLLIAGHTEVYGARRRGHQGSATCRRGHVYSAESRQRHDERGTPARLQGEYHKNRDSG